MEVRLSVTPSPEQTSGFVTLPARGDQRAALRLHYLTAGPADAPPAVLLHGFPEFSFAWRHQIPALAAAGHRVIAPDLCGYNLSAKPPRVADYAIERLVADVASLIDQLAGGRAAVVGHDWGGNVAWHLAAAHPARVRKLVILNAPHPAAYRRDLFRTSQFLRSYYVLLFQLPWLPEAVLRWNDFAIVRRFLARGPARTPAEVEAYVRALAVPGALTATIHYYRAAARQFGRATAEVNVDVPTLVVWGDRDAFLVPSVADGLQRWVPDLRVERLPDATHWLHHEAAGRLNELLVEFLGPGG